MKTTNGKRGGNLVGKPHNDKNGKPVGGIKAQVTDAGGKPVELEGGEVIINKEASKKHWKELSRINQSAGNGVPIKAPIDPHDEDPSDYGVGGKIIEFNRNHLPNKWILSYAKGIKNNHPEIWKLGGNIYGNTAFENLLRVSERGYWLDTEEWMYKKWQSFLARHQHDFRIAGVVAVLKWGGKVNKGWAYMKDLIEDKIAKKKKMAQGGELIKRADGSYSKRGLWDNIRDNAGSGKKPTKEMLEQEAKIKAKSMRDGGSVKNTNLPKVGSEVRARWNGTMQWSSGIFKGETENGFEVYDFSIEQPKYIEFYSEISIDPYNGSEIFKSNNFKGRNKKNYHFTKNNENYADGGSVGFEDKLFTELAEHDAPSFRAGGKVKKSNKGGDCYKAAGDIVIDSRFINKNRFNFNGTPYLVHAEVAGQGAISGIRYGHAWIEDDVMVYDYSNGRELQIPKQIYYAIGNIETSNPKKYRKYTFEQARRKMSESGTYGCWDLDVQFKEGGQLLKGIRAEMEHKDTINKFKREGISDKAVAKSIAKDHLKEDSKYYTKLNKMEGKMARGGNLEQHIKTKLSKSFSLPFELAVYVPSTKGADEIISNTEFKSRIKQVEVFLSNLFGGFSKSDVDGGYMSSEKGLITEDVAKVTAFGQRENFESKLPKLMEQISQWCEEWTQESMGFEFEGDLFYVEKGFQYGKGGSIEDENADMVRSQNIAISHHTKELQTQLKKGKETPAWVVSKVSRASNDLSDVTHYLEGKKMADGGNINHQYFVVSAKDGKVVSKGYKTEEKAKQAMYKLYEKTKDFSYTTKKMRAGGNVYSEDYVRWETELAYELSDMLEIGYGDAQGIIEANDGFIKEAYRKGWAYDLTAKEIAEKDADYEDGGNIESEKLIERRKMITKMQDEITKRNRVQIMVTDVEMPKFGEIDFSKPTRNDESRAFINTFVYNSEMDYVIGGFPHDKLNNISIVGNSNAISMAKLEMIYADRINRLIEDFKNEIFFNISKTEQLDVMAMENEIRDELDNLYSLYLGENVFTTNTNDLADMILEHSSFNTWKARIEERLDEYQSSIEYKGNVNDTTNLKMDISDIEEITYDATLEQLLEKLSIITEQNEL
jgi:hypothetical protein